MLLKGQGLGGGFGWGTGQLWRTAEHPHPRSWLDHQSLLHAKNMHGGACDCAVVAAGRPGLSKPLRLLWFAAPFVFSPAHAGTDYVSTHRVLKFDRMAREAMQKIGVPIADATAITQSMWEAAYDGLHYLRGSNDNWNGHISSFVQQVQVCTGLPWCATHGFSHRHASARMPCLSWAVCVCSPGAAERHLPNVRRSGVRGTGPAHPSTTCCGHNQQCQCGTSALPHLYVFMVPPPSQERRFWYAPAAVAHACEPCRVLCFLRSGQSHPAGCQHSWRHALRHSPVPLPRHRWEMCCLR